MVVRRCDVNFKHGTHLLPLLPLLLVLGGQFHRFRSTTVTRVCVYIYIYIHVYELLANVITNHRILMWALKRIKW